MPDKEVLVNKQSPFSSWPLMTTPTPSNDQVWLWWGGLKDYSQELLCPHSWFSRVAVYEAKHNVN